MKVRRSGDFYDPFLIENRFAVPPTFCFLVNTVKAHLLELQLK